MARFVSSLILVGFLVACAPQSGKEITQPISAALFDIGFQANSLLRTGAKPADLRVETIVKDDKKAQAQVVVISKQVDTVQAQVVKAQHRIFIDDCVFGAVAAAVLIPILIKLLPFLMAL